jgi:hypothetical protein
MTHVVFEKPGTTYLSLFKPSASQIEGQGGLVSGTRIYPPQRGLSGFPAKRPISLFPLPFDRQRGR